MKITQASMILPMKTPATLP